MDLLFRLTILGLVIHELLNILVVVGMASSDVSKALNSGFYLTGECYFGH